MTSLTQKISQWTRTAALMLPLAGCYELPERSSVEDGREQQENREEKSIDALVSANEPREDIPSETSRENALSQNSYPYQVLGKPVFFKPRLEKDEEGKIAKNLDKTVTETQSVLDEFDGLYRSLRKVVITKDTDYFRKIAARAEVSERVIRIYVVSDINHAFVHELTHTWHLTLEEEKRFSDAWNSIVGQGCYRVKCDDGSDGGDRSETCAVSVAAISLYGATDQVEDVAELGKFVYNLLHPRVSYHGFPNEPSHIKRAADNTLTKTISAHTVTRANIPRIKAKVDLLHEYGFLSERENRYVQAELDGFKGGGLFGYLDNEGSNK